jgi:phosphoserine phosphatase
MRLTTPDRAMCAAAAARCIASIVPGALEFIRRAKDDGWLPIMLSGGIMPVVSPLAQVSGIEHVEAVPMDFQMDGSYLSYDSGFPTAGNHGKASIIREWISAMLPERVVMIGDSLPDLETKPFVDVFIAFRGVVDRPRITAEAGWVCNDLETITHPNGLVIGTIMEKGMA